MATNIPNKIIVHHTGGSDANPLQDSSNFTFEACDKLHKEKFNMKSSLGFYVGYHYYIEKNGTLKQARLDIDEGAHTIGQNTSSIGVCLAGNFDLTLPTEAQTIALTALLITLSMKYGIAPENIYPHRSFSSKTCYGNKLSSLWASNLVRNFLNPIPPVVDVIKEMTREEKVAKALALIREAAELLK